MQTRAFTAELRGWGHPPLPGPRGSPRGQHHGATLEDEGASWGGAGPGTGQHLAGAQVCIQAGPRTPEGSAEQVCREPGWRGHRDDQGKFHLFAEESELHLV